MKYQYEGQNIKYDKQNIKYEEQKRFPTCRDKLPLAFDFYIPSHNLLLEYDGEAHFEPVYWSKSITIEQARKRFTTQQYRDALKTEWALQNKYTLLRIKYGEDVEKILYKIFKGNDAIIQHF